MTEHQKTHTRFRWQRKLMPGGTCEATAFSTYGYRSTCLCLPLGNYHNMVDIDQVQAGQRPARVGPEFISVADFHGLVEMLVLCAEGLESPTRPTLHGRMETLLKEHGHVLDE
jgi:endoglucanase